MVEKLMGEDGVRLHLLVTKRTKERIESLIKKTEAMSMTEVVRRALALYEDLVDAALAGSKVVVVSKKGEQVEILTT